MAVDIPFLRELDEDVSATSIALKNAYLNGDSQVQRFYDGAVVFVTGGSGFIGKHLIEKLLRSSSIKKIYLLLRPRKTKTIEERLKSILKNTLFDYLYEEQPNFVDKLVPVEGDMSELRLGIADEIWTKIAEEVTVIFNAAASVNFRETIKASTLTNIRGAREVIDLARASKNLKAIVHVSTAYAYATKSRIDKNVAEDFHECPLPPNALIELGEALDEEQLAAMIDPAMQDWPNSYTFTKAIAEELVRVHGRDLPLCIVRPSVVISSYREPKPGWIDFRNIFGPSGLILGSCLGAIHTLHGKGDVLIDFIPVDIVNNAIIVSAHETHERHRNNEKDIKIYTASACDNSIKWKGVIDTLREKSYELQTAKSVWWTAVLTTKIKFFYLFLNLIYHYIPGLIADGILILMNKKPRIFSTYKMIHNLSTVFNYFLHNYWRFENYNTRELYNKLSATDKVIYNCDTTSFDNRQLICRWAYGVIRYIVKDDFSNIEYGFKKQFYFQIATYIILPVYLYSLYKLTFVFVVFVFNALIYLFSFFRLL